MRRTSPTDGTSPRRRMIRSAISPVQPVWWNAPSRGAVVAVEVLAEDQVVFPGGIGLHPLGAAEAGPPPSGPRVNSEMSRSCRSATTRSKRQPLARAGRVLDRLLVAEEPVVALERADHQVVHREPDRAAPVGVAAEHGRGGLGRLVVDDRAWSPRRRRSRGGRGGRRTARAGRAGTGTRPRRRAWSSSRSSRSGRATDSSSRWRRPGPVAAQPAAPGQLVLVGEAAHVSQESAEVLVQRQRAVQHAAVDDRRAPAAGMIPTMRADLHRDVLAGGRDQPVVVEPVGLVPQALAFDGVPDRGEVLEELQHQVGRRAAGRPGSGRPRSSTWPARRRPSSRWRRTAPGCRRPAGATGRSGRCCPGRGSRPRTGCCPRRPPG